LLKYLTKAGRSYFDLFYKEKDLAGQFVMNLSAVRSEIERLNEVQKELGRKAAWFW